MDAAASDGAGSARPVSTAHPPAASSRSRSRHKRRVGPALTRQGLFYVLLALAVGAAALISRNNLLYLVLSAMLAALLVSGLASRLSVAGLELRISLPEQVFARAPALVSVGLRNLKSWMPSFAIEVRARPKQALIFLDSVYFPAVGRGRRSSATVRVAFPRRGSYASQAVELATRFPFGFVERRARLELRDPIVVFPSIEPTDESKRIVDRLTGRSAANLRGESQDLYRLRPARSGDSARFADWKASARTRELWVREFSSDQQSRVRLRLDRRSPEGDEFDVLVETCAAVIWELDRRGAGLAFTCDDRTFRCEPGGGAVYDILQFLAVVEPTDEPAEGPASDLLLDDKSFSFSVAGERALRQTG